MSLQNARRAHAIEIEAYKAREVALLARVKTSEENCARLRQSFTNLTRTRAEDMNRLEALLQQERAARARAEHEIARLNKGPEEDEIPEALWDEKEGVFRCPESGCMYEVVDDFCQGCGQVVFCDLEGNDCDANPNAFSSSIDSQAVHEDRCRAPRGTTPLLEIPRSVQALPGYTYQEYHALLQRGATRLMCEAFKLDYTPEDGIYAWADQELYEQFSGPAMLDEQRWKIHLGRRIQLDEDDPDGSAFIEGLLEDAILFPPFSSPAKGDRWITTLEKPNVWVTRLPSSDADDDAEHECTKSRASESGSSEDSDGSTTSGANSDNEDSDEDSQDEDDEDDDDSDNDCKRIDRQLVNPVDPNAESPVILVDAYEEDATDTEDTDGLIKGEVGDVAMSDADANEIWRAGGPDTAYPDEEYEEEHEEKEGELEKTAEANAEVESAAVATEDVEMTDDSDSDAVDSDFDEDEVLSGDEFVLQGWRARHPPVQV